MVVVINEVPGLLKGWSGRKSQSFFSQVGEETFHGRIVPTIAKLGHGRSNCIMLGEESIGMGSILVAMITVQEEFPSDLLLLLGLFEGIQDTTERVPPCQVMRNNEAIEEILDCGKVCPALLGCDISNVRDPFLVGLVSVKLPLENIFIVMLEFCYLAENPALARHGANIHFVHESQNSLVIHANSLLLLEPQGNPAVAIGAVRFLICFLDVLHPFCIRIGLI